MRRFNRSGGVAMKMKQVLLQVVISIFLLTMLTGCAGIADWEYRGLPGECVVVRLNAYTKYIMNGECTETYIENYVDAFATDGKFIYAKRIEPEEIDKWFPKKTYCVLDTETYEVVEFETKEEFEAHLTELELETKVDWISTKQNPN